MPTYEYRCAKCGNELEVFQTFAEAPLTKHTGCGGKLAKVLSPAGIVLKGSGFYKTDNRSSSKRSGSGSDAHKDKESSSSGSGESRSSESSGSGSGDSKKSDSSGSGSGGSNGSGSRSSGSGGSGSRSSGSDSKKPAAKSA